MHLLDLSDCHAFFLAEVTVTANCERAFLLPNINEPVLVSLDRESMSGMTIKDVSKMSILWSLSQTQNFILERLLVHVKQTKDSRTK